MSDTLREFYAGRRVFLTGHTGFKGSWLSLWLHALGARVTGYALDPPTAPSLFELCRVGELVASHRGDIRDLDPLARCLHEARPEVVFHLAAQPLVLEAYRDPIGTVATNILGTAHVLEAVRRCGGVRAVVVVTTDKCYENQERSQGYREDDRLGGYDPYSASKACAELVTASYRTSFFHPDDLASHGTGVATARAGNVLGGGDWAADRLVPDCVRAWLGGPPIVLRRPAAVRPWQHVLDPLGGYLLLARLLATGAPGVAEAWNFGPDDADSKPVEWVVRQLCARWGEGAGYTVDSDGVPHETQELRLDCTKARARLGWRPRWPIDVTLDKVIEWTRAYRAREDVRAVALRQIEEYLRA